MKTYSFLFSLFPFLFGCQSIILGEQELNRPENNFELFWNDFDLHYGLFEARGWNWDSIYSHYQPQINELTTNEELWSTFQNMISYLDDSHTFIESPEYGFFVSGATENEQVFNEFSLELVAEKYVEITGASEAETYAFGKVKDKDIGYIHFSGIDLSSPEIIDNILTTIGQHQAIILDLRNNTGGDDLTAVEIAGRFTTEEQLIYTVQERNGPAHNDFSDKLNYYSKVVGEQHFDGPVTLLTDRVTASAAEVMCFHFKSFPNVTQIGDETAGDFSDSSMRRFLPNGWQYQYSIMQFLLPDGSSLDGIGHIPAIYVRNTVQDITAENDLVIERALQYLFEEYGIE